MDSDGEPLAAEEEALAQKGKATLARHPFTAEETAEVKKTAEGFVKLIAIRARDGPRASPAKCERISKRGIMLAWRDGCMNKAKKLSAEIRSDDAQIKEPEHGNQAETYGALEALKAKITDAQTFIEMSVHEEDEQTLFENVNKGP